MSFHDGVPMASILDDIDLKSIVMVLKDHRIFVGPSIVNNREYLYYFIGNCNDIQQDAFRNYIIRRFHGVNHVCLKSSTSLLPYILKIRRHDASMETHYTRQELLSHLDMVDLKRSYVNGNGTQATLDLSMVLQSKRRYEDIIKMVLWRLFGPFLQQKSFRMSFYER
ncbi:hypothetical protein EDD18DRAFT_1140077 [Armillaria luteobubalina]|uniref:Uncharacterized protein n=1 Tax=Armillaria luteobubalina TaxID=153913 RepID=A0AA39QIM0_9AGAR|nr:hypothetical protein EDD18DRAFT_1140077 [Armillaria luteobubalina]